MKRCMICLLAAAAVALTGVSANAGAVTTKKQKRAVVAKKPVKGVRVAKIFNAPRERAGVSGLSSDLAKHLGLQSSAVLVQDQTSGAVLFQKNAATVQPIASITKLMTAMVVLDQQPDLEEVLIISQEDIDLLKGTRSRLSVGTQMTRGEMLRLALMSSENRAASALSRYYPGGHSGFVLSMNLKADVLGLADTRFEDATGLTAANVSSPRDLARMVDAAYQYPLIREFSTTPGSEFTVSGRSMQFNNTNSLVKSPHWDIGLSKTGYISEAGKCLVMQVWLNSKPTIIVLLDSMGKMTRVGDANRIKRWVESAALVRPSAG